MTDVLFISEKYIKTNSSLNDNVWGDSLLPAIRESMDINLQSAIGSELYQTLIEEVKTNTLSEVHKTLMDNYIQPYLMYQTIAGLIPILGSKIGNIGTVVSEDEYVVSLSQGEREDLTYQYQYKADHYRETMIKFLKDNKLIDCTESGTSISSSLWMGGYRGRIIKDKSNT